MGVFSKIVSKALKNPPVKKASGVRMGDKNKFQKGSAPTSTADTNKNATSNKNTSIASPKELLKPSVMAKAAIEDAKKSKGVISQTNKKGEPLKGAAKEAKQSAGVRATTRNASRAGYVGGAATAVVMAAKDEDKPKKELKGRPVERSSDVTPKAKDKRVNKSDYPTYKKSTESASGFREAFKKAKSAGKETFTFEDRSYSTKEKDMNKGGMVKSGPRLGKK